jgi:transcription elongation factor Elf1
MPDLVTLSCPSCSGKLNITNDIERFACGNCGREHVVKRAGGIVSLSLFIEALKKVEVGVNKTASELAINRLQREIDEQRSQRAALIASSPKPQVNIVFPFLIVAGILVAVVSLSTRNVWVPIL